MTAELNELQAVVAEFPPDLVRKVIEYAKRLTPTNPAGYDADEPTEEELREAHNRDLQRFEDEHSGEDWSQQPFTPGYK